VSVRRFKTEAAATPAVGPRTDAAAPAVGVAALLAATVALAAVVAAGLAAVPAPTDPPTAALSLEVDADADRLTLTHRAGDPLDVRALTLRVRVGGEPLAHQPPVPFFAARGCRAGPTGAFNAGADPVWRPGEAASLRLASTNGPLPAAGDPVTVTVAVEGHVVAEVTATAGARVGARPRSAAYSGTSARLTMARGLPGLACMTVWSASRSPAARNIRSASSAS